MQEWMIFPRMSMMYVLIALGRADGMGDDGIGKNFKPSHSNPVGKGQQEQRSAEKHECEQIRTNLGHVFFALF